MKTIDTSTVTPEQVSRCTRIVDLNGEKPEVFYLVLSETQDLVEYKVRYLEDKKCFTCTCGSGQVGFTNVRHPSGVCKHVRWSVKAAEEHKANEKALGERTEREQEQAVKQAKLDRIRKFVELGLTHPQALQASETYTTLSDEDLARTFKVPTRRGPKPKNDTRVFSLMR